MGKFILFLKRASFFVLFVFLEALAVNFYAKSTSYTRARLLTVSNNVVGGVRDMMSGLDDYFSLRKQNIMLTGELARLNNELESYREFGAERPVSHRVNQYAYMPAKVINNSVSRQQNYFTLDRGLRDGVVEGMAVISTDGVAVGYVMSCSDKMCVCISVLNTGFRTSGKIKGGGHFGSIFWDGTSGERITMEEMSKYAGIEKGDTIVTTDYSAIFPADVKLGTVESYRLSDNSAYYIVEVKLGTHISALNHVFIVSNEDAAEQRALETEYEEEEEIPGS